MYLKLLITTMSTKYSTRSVDNGVLFYHVLVSEYIYLVSYVLHRFLLGDPLARNTIQMFYSVRSAALALPGAR